MVIDAHVHLLPGRLGQKVRSIFEDLGGYSLAYPADHGAICAQLAQEGVDGIWTLPYAHKAGVARSLNDAACATAVGELAVTVVPGATVHPEDVDPVGVLRSAVEDGGARVLKLHCSVGAFEPTDPGLDHVWTYVSETRVPVVVHAGHAVDGLSEPQELVAIDEVARRYPEARVIIAHCGHHAEVHALDLVERHPHVYADLTPVVDRLVQVPPARAQVLWHKLLYGTDAPNTSLDGRTCQAHVRSLGLSEDGLAAVLGGTAARLVAEVRT